MPLEDPRITALLSRWHLLFGQTPVTVRTVVVTALEHDPELLTALTDLVPEIASAPQPRTFSRWLLRHENFPLSGEDQTFRLVRTKNTVDGALWLLRPISELAVA